MNSSYFEIIFMILLFSSVSLKLCYSECARAEYEMDNGECCPMCAPGNRVYRDCTEFTSTTCVPCMDSTFLDAPNGLKQCFSCSVCDPGVGLRVKTSCTRTSDTVCESLEGYYCTNENRGSCIKALKHTKCSPGEYIQHIGTGNRDTVCGKCAEGSYSNGTLQTCQPHTKCEDRGLIEENPGTAESDTECGNKSPVGLIVGIVFPILGILVAAAILIFLIKKEKVKSPIPCPAWITPTRPQQETGQEDVFLSNRSSHKPDPQEMSEDDFAQIQEKSRDRVQIQKKEEQETKTLDQPLY